MNIFDKYNSDFLRVSWAHAINSKESLVTRLNEDVDCIESDLIYCNEDNEVYMAHPPAIKSNLTFKEYWNICKMTKKLLKLDFKTIDAVEPCLKLLNPENNHNIMLNADILKSTMSDFDPVNKDDFVELCFKYLPASSLSLGWTTVKESVIGYTWSDIYEMYNFLKKFKDSEKMITIPVNAHMVSLNSVPKLIFLLDQFRNGNGSITIWTRQEEKVHLESLKMLRRLLSKTSIFIDMPQLLNGEREEILFVEPRSNSSIAIHCPVFTGTNFYSSRRSLMIDKNTKITFQEPLSIKLECFIIFDTVSEEHCEEISSCIIKLKSKDDVVDLISLTKNGISPGYGVVETNSKFEIVYFVSISFVKSSLQFSVSTVLYYNSLSMEMVNQFSTMKNISDDGNLYLVIDADCRGSDCRFIVIDFPDKN